MTTSFNTRFSLKSFVERVKKLSNDQKDLIKSIGFGHLLGLRYQKLSKHLLAELMDRWSFQKQAFELPTGAIKITLMDAALILGLRVTGERVVLKKDGPLSKLGIEYGATVRKKNISVASLEKRLQNLMIADEDFVRTFLLFVFGTLLFPNSSGTVDLHYLSLLEDLNKASKLAWGAAVLNELLYWMDRKKCVRNIKSVGGCLIFLQIWSFEHINIACPSLPECYLTYPRACRWHNIDYHLRQWFTTKFDELHANQITWQLHLTSEESNIDIIRELLEVQEDNMELPCTSGHSSRSDIVTYIVESESEVGSVKELIVVPEDDLELQSTSECICTNATIDDVDTNRTRLLEKENTELKKEIDELRRELQILKDEHCYENSLAFRLEKILLGEDIHAESREQRDIKRVIPFQNGTDTQVKGLST